MTDIKNKIEEEARKYAEAYGINIVPIHNDLSVYYTDCYEAGARSILEKWKDASRWRKVSDELPCINQQVLVKYQTYEIAIARYKGGKFYTKVVNATFGTRVIEWKPID